MGMGILLLIEVLADPPEYLEFFSSGQARDTVLKPMEASLHCLAFTEGITQIRRVVQILRRGVIEPEPLNPVSDVSFCREFHGVPVRQQLIIKIRWISGEHNETR